MDKGGNELEETMNSKVLTIMELALLLKEKGIDAFVGYYPHVDSISVRIFKTGWTEQECPIIMGADTIVKPYPQDDLDEIIEMLEHLYEGEE